MKESYVEGLAAHDGPESCVGVRKGDGEALTGVRAGRVFSRERHNPPGCRRCKEKRKATSGVPVSRGTTGPRAVADPVHVRKHLARDPGGPAFARPGFPGRPRREVFGRTPTMHERGKSDGPIVPGKSPNNGDGNRLDRCRPVPSSAEGMEGRGPAKGNRRATRTGRTQDRMIPVSQVLTPIRWKERVVLIVFTSVRHYPRQEPDAVVPHVRICAGGGPKGPSLPRPCGHWGRSSRRAHYARPPPAPQSPAPRTRRRGEGAKHRGP